MFEPIKLLYATRNWSGHDELFVEKWRELGLVVETVVLNAQKGPGTPREISEFTASFVEMLKVFTPDFVQAGPLTDVGVVARRCWPGPLISTSWGFDVLQEIVDNKKLMSSVINVVKSSELVFVDSAVTAKFANRFDVPHSRIVEFPWGIDLNFFRPPGVRKVSKSSLIVFTCRSHEDIYRVGDIIDAFALACEQSEGLFLRIAGSGALSEVLHQRVADNGLHSKVAFLGRLDAMALLENYQSSDIYVSAARVDGTSVSLLEALACELTVCVSDIPGNRQWVDASTGFLFPVGDTDTLANHLLEIERLKRSEAHEIQRRSVAGRERVNALADWSKVDVKFHRAIELLGFAGSKI